MAQIREFTIEGLAGRTEPLSVVLNPDVNVFFGLNGSGKTTLLKILQSALSTETDILKDVPFTRAAIKIYLNRHKAVFVRTITRKEQTSNEEITFSAPALQKSLWGNIAYGEFGTHRGSSVPTNFVYDAQPTTVVSAPA